MSVESAEMTKHAINAFLATSVTFANEIASLCELVGADAKEVERGLKTEARIGPKAYLSPGAAFAGGTLARDIRFLNKISNDRHLTTPLISPVLASNDEHKRWVTRKLSALIHDLPKATVAVWGLTYKAGTDTLRRSLAVELCDWLVAQAANVHVHDPAVKALPVSWNSKVTRFDTPLEALKNARVLVISTEWPLYKSVCEADIVGIAPGITVLDANRFLAHLSNGAGLKYLAVGTPEQTLDN